MFYDTHTVLYFVNFMAIPYLSVSMQRGTGNTVVAPTELTLGKKEEQT